MLSGGGLAEEAVGGRAAIRGEFSATAPSRALRLGETNRARLRATRIEHRFTRIKHPWTNGQVERMNRTIKDATVKRFHYDSHDQFRRHLDDFVAAHNVARRLKRLRGLTPYEFICKAWADEPDRFILNPHRKMPGLDTYPAWIAAIIPSASGASGPLLIAATAWSSSLTLDVPISTVGISCGIAA